MRGLFSHQSIERRFGVVTDVRQGKKRRLSSFALFAGFAVLGVYLVLSLISTQVEIGAKRQQLANVQAHVDEQSAQNTELQRTMEAEDEGAYIGRIAREKLGYVSPDEQVYVDMSGK